jgi:hypothetical protein
MISYSFRPTLLCFCVERGGGLGAISGHHFRTHLESGFTEMTLQGGGNLWALVAHRLWGCLYNYVGVAHALRAPWGKTPEGTLSCLVHEVALGRYVENMIRC